MRTAILVFTLAHTLAAQPASLRGVITDALTHRPLEGVSIVIRTPEKPLATTSGVSGDFFLFQIPAGRASLELTKEGYAKLNAVLNPAECSITFKAGDRLQRNFELQPGSSISGHLLDRDTDQPIPGLRVWAMQEDYGVGAKRYISSGASQPSTEAGEFAIRGLRPGDYVLEIRQAEVPKVVPEVVPEVTPGPDEKKKQQKQYATSYFPGVPRLEMAAPLTLATADHRTLDMRVTSGGLRSLSGEVEALKGSGKINVLLIKEEPGSFTMIASGNLPAPGSFHIEGLSQGVFNLLAYTQGPDNLQFLEYPIEILNHDLEDIKLRLLPALTVKGSVQAAKDAGDLPSTKLIFELIPIKRIHVENEATPTNFTAPGVFERPRVLAGIYYPLLSRLPEGWAVTEVHFAGAVLPYGAALTIDDRTLDPSINFILSPKLGTVSGSIRDSNGNPIPGTKIALLPYPIPDLFNPNAIRIQTVDPQGNATFQKLPPGKYKAIPLTGTAAKSDRDLATLREHATFLDTFEVQPNQTATISIKP